MIRTGTNWLDMKKAVYFSLANSFDVKFEPWSVRISSGMPTLEKNLTSSSAIVSASIALRGIASECLVA